MLLWLWYRPAATAPIRPLAWEPPYAAGMPLKRQAKKKNLYSEVPLPFNSRLPHNMTPILERDHTWKVFYPNRPSVFSLMKENRAISSVYSLMSPSMLWPSVPHPSHGTEDEVAEAG